MEMFKKLGPRVVIVELRGRVAGLVTVKDVLKYQFKVENEENPRTMGPTGLAEERVWGWIEGVARVLGGLWSRVGRRGGGIRIEHTPRMGSEDEVELVETPR
jgi:chloride channel 3/4/5